MGVNRIAEDEEVIRTLKINERGETLASIGNPTTRRFTVYRIIDTLVGKGILPERGRKRASVNGEASAVTSEAPAVEEPLLLPSLYEEHLARYEERIGAPEKRNRSGKGAPSPTLRAVCFADPHVRLQRHDLVVKICKRHEGEDLFILGDLLDFEEFSRFIPEGRDYEPLHRLLASADAFLGFLCGYFPRIHLLLGNHDNRLHKKVARNLGPDYGWLTQQFLVTTYQKRHGVSVLNSPIQRHNGSVVENIYSWTQVGDCIMSHCEVSGRRGHLSRSAEKAHDYFYSWREEFGLKPFRVVLQSHSHRQVLLRHPMTGVYCIETGSICDIPDYALRDHRTTPPQNGYFHLVQVDGKTDMEESRLFHFE
jgi:hypothetical protein